MIVRYFFSQIMARIHAHYNFLLAISTLNTFL